jgi:hypothetical protein
MPEGSEVSYVFYFTQTVSNFQRKYSMTNLNHSHKPLEPHVNVRHCKTVPNYQLIHAHIS